MTVPGAYTFRTVTPDSIRPDLVDSAVNLPLEAEEGLDQDIAEGHISFFVAETSARAVVGRVAVNWRGPGRTPIMVGNLPGVPVVAFMEVAENYRGRGIGRGLLETVMSAARERRYEMLCLSVGVDPAAEHARELYESEGFQEWTLGRFVVWDALRGPDNHFVWADREMTVMTRSLVND